MYLFSPSIVGNLFLLPDRLSHFSWFHQQPQSNPTNSPRKQQALLPHSSSVLATRRAGASASSALQSRTAGVSAASAFPSHGSDTDNIVAPGVLSGAEKREEETAGGGTSKLKDLEMFIQKARAELKAKKQRWETIADEILPNIRGETETQPKIGVETEIQALRADFEAEKRERETAVEEMQRKTAKLGNEMSKVKQTVEQVCHPIPI